MDALFLAPNRDPFALIGAALSHCNSTQIGDADDKIAISGC